MTTAPPPAAPVVDALARLARSRDPAAWSALVEAIGDELARTCTGVAGPDLGQDALQETLIRLRDRAARFHAPADGDRERAARGWARRVATTTALELVRSRRRRRRRDAEPLSEAPVDDPADLAARSERDGLIRRELAALPRDQREAVTLHYLLGTPLAEVAAGEGIAVEAAKKRAQRGAERLRRRLGRFGVSLSLPALGAVLGELRADEIALDREHALAALTSHPAPVVGALKGAVMALAIALPVVIAASIFAADARPPKPLPAGAEPPPKAAAADPQVTLAWNDLDLATAMAQLAKLSGERIAIADDVIDVPPVTLAVDRMKCSYVLDLVCRLTALHWQRRPDRSIVVSAAQPPPTPEELAAAAAAEVEHAAAATRAAAAETAWRAEVAPRLAEKVAVDFTDTPAEDAIAYLRRASKLDIVIAAEVYARHLDHAVTLHDEGIALGDALDRVADEIGCEALLTHHGVMIDPKDLVPADAVRVGGH